MLAQLSGSLLHSLHHFQRWGRGAGGGGPGPCLAPSFISTEAEGVGRAWTTPHLCRSPLSLTLPSPLTPAVGMLLPASQGGLQHGSQPLSLPAPAR